MKRLAIFLILLALFSGQLQAQPIEPGEPVLGPSGLPLPRFVSISADRANLRTGPGEQYPIVWVYEKKLYPLEIIEEYDSWRKVRDIEGDEGWMHVVLLSGKRTGLVTGGIRTLYDDPEVTSQPVARVETGVIGEILECVASWCRIDVGPEEGWIQEEALWGIYLGEEID